MPLKRLADSPTYFYNFPCILFSQGFAASHKRMYFFEAFSSKGVVSGVTQMTESRADIRLKATVTASHTELRRHINLETTLGSLEIIANNKKQHKKPACLLLGLAMG
ncbi:hypothetical protein ATANTOWER_015218 [Ataeniobius toweri]|uniref:LAGLIDADG homing endonuclease n=1 Tax=Ataeniobius toweri TaxID=208326 RepID=A0ABU7AFH7_9TELE|nr:hypothetical protein [Ataeniobius toweri]